MDKKRIELIITSILVLILIFAWVNNARLLKKRRSAVPVKSEAPSVLKEQGNIQKGEKEVWDTLRWARDPFSGRVYPGAGAGPANLELQGVSWDEARPQALIGGEIVREGDTLGNYIVIKIKKDSVLLNDGTKDFELKLE